MFHFGLRRAIDSSPILARLLDGAPLPETIDLGDPGARRDAARRVSVRTGHSAADIESMLQRLSWHRETVSADDVMRLSERALAAGLPLP